MGLIVDKIDRVRIYAVPGGIWADGGAVGVGRAAVVKWKSGWADKLYQVYVNGRLAGCTVDVRERELAILVGDNGGKASRVEVFAVEPAQAWKDFGGELESNNGSGRVCIRYLRDQRLGLGAVLNFYSNGGSGEIDYARALNAEPVRIWPRRSDKGGFGMSCFGGSDFGYDGSAAVGLGKGVFGYGSFGEDGEIIEWVSEPLADGVYRFAVTVTDRRGNESDGFETEEILVSGGARAFEQLHVSAAAESGTVCFSVQ